jgi:hypothetical protein
VHGHQGQQLSDAALPAEVVSQAFTWSAAAGVSCVAFLGDECATLQLTDDLRELHTRCVRVCVCVCVCARAAQATRRMHALGRASLAGCRARTPLHTQT